MKNELISIVVVTRNREKDLHDCLASLKNQTYDNLQVIVVDNASDKPQRSWIIKKFPRATVVRSEANLGGAGGRNLGLQHCKGDIIFFMDDDAVADSELIVELKKSIAPKKVGIVQPKIYDKAFPDMFQGLGHGINFLTGKVYGVGIREIDREQYPKDFEIPMAGCAWMVKREVIDKIGNYDEDYFIPYEDTDFAWRARKAGYAIILSAKAKVWHQGPKSTSQHPRLQWLGITTPDKAYRLARNKIIFMVKHAPFVNLILFILFFVPLYGLLHSIIIISTGYLSLLSDYWKGVFSGLYYLIKHKL